MKKIFYCCVLLLGLSAFSQINEEPMSLSPEGVLENIFDQNGNSYKLSDIVVGKEVRDPNGVLLRATNPLPMTCGYFNLYFEDGCGLTSSDPDYLNRRAVICQVFTDLSNFINSPLTNVGNTTRVNIWVRNIDNVIQNPNNLNPPPSTGVLGLASSFYSMPYNTTSGFGGIVDNEVWKTIHTGVDSYTNVISPLVSSGISSGTSGVFYHGMMAFNFTDTVSPINWNTSLTSTSFPGLYDLYTVVLHELTHALGFASLINANGGSKFASGYNYYSRYDRFLKNNGNTQFLLTNTGACSPMYNYAFNSALNSSILHPAYTAPNYCTNAIKYISSTTNVPVYTPVTFEPPSSLSHFEDLLFPSCVSPYGSNLYFTMSKAIGSNVRKRFLKPEERRVLGDLGYSLKTTYGVSTTYQGTTTYAGTITGIPVAGINDGINSNGSYRYIGTATTSSPIVINSSTDTSRRILANDTSATGFECLQDVFSTATFSATSGTSLTDVTFSSTVPGLHLLRYVPVNGTLRGNITYIYVFVTAGNCTPSACNIVSNGEFESSSSCGQLGVTVPPPVIDCWTWLAQSPDLFKRNCTSNNNYFNVGVQTAQNTSAVNSYNGGSNNSFTGLYRYGSSTNPNSNSFLEAMQATLGSPLVAGQQYTISFWARGGNQDTNLAVPVPLNFSSFPSTLIPISLLGNNFQAVVPDSVNLIPTTFVPKDNAWHFYSFNFTFPANTPNHSALGVYTAGSASTRSYVYVDGISIIQINGTFNLPTNLCRDTQSIPDLRDYLSGLPTDGVFAGEWVNYNGSTYSLNEMFDLNPGLTTVSYTYTNASGCPVTLYSSTNVIFTLPTITGSTAAHPTAPNNTTVNSTTIPAGYTALWTITGGTGTITTANNQPNVGVTWSALPGYLTLTLTSPSGCTFTASQSIFNLATCSCLNNMTFTVTGSGLTKTFAPQYNNGSCSGAAVRFYWDFGDGATSGYPNPSHTYLTAGTYQVTLTPRIVGAMDEALCMGTPYVTSINVSGGIKGGKQKLNSQITIYPNPASSLLNLDVSLEEKGSVETIIRSVDGKELLRKKWDLETGKHDLQLELPNNISDGMIFVEIISNQIKETRTVIIKK